MNGSKLRARPNLASLVRAAQRSSGIAALDTLMKRHGFPAWVEEYRFWPGRDFRFDRAWPAAKVAAEYEGGIWAKGRGEGGAEPCPACGQRPKGAHGHPLGIVRDVEKYNGAAMLGWKVIRVHKETLKDGSAIEFLAAVLGVVLDDVMAVSLDPFGTAPTGGVRRRVAG